MGEAAAGGAGVALLHSHPLGPRMAGDEQGTMWLPSKGNARPAVFGATGFPLGSDPCGDGAWSARFWERIAPRTYPPELVRNRPVS